MTLESQRGVISVNGVAVPGVYRNGVFIGEQPVNTFIVNRSGAFLAAQVKSFFVDFPILLKLLIISDTTNNNTYTLTILSPEGVTWTMVIPVAQATSTGTCKTINLPQMALDKGTKVSISAVNAFQSMAMYSNLAYNIDVKDF